ncbi:MAG: hypothetical protein RLZZ305_648 [Actinomycetota bacterium]
MAQPVPFTLQVTRYPFGTVISFDGCTSDFAFTLHVVRFTMNGAVDEDGFVVVPVFGTAGAMSAW